MNSFIQAWICTIREEKLLLILDYYELIEELCEQFKPEDKQPLKKLKENIQKKLKQLIEKLKPDSQPLDQLTGIINK